MVFLGSWLRSAALVLALSAVVMGVPAPAGAESERLGSEAGIGAGAALCSLLYGPTKLLYAGGGALIAGLAWAFSGGDAAVARPVLTAALRGDYVVTPAHLRGEEPLEFIGRAPADRRLRAPVEPTFETEF